MKNILLIGLGRFGTSVAQTLYESNEEVLAIDSDEEIVQDWEDMLPYS
jgi:trk system potassium uptake protein TrkA